MASKQEELRARLMGTFRVEAEEHLQALGSSLLALERGVPSTEAKATVDIAFREMHTLKGAARSVGLMDLERVCQACESLLSRLARGQLQPGRQIVTRLQEALDTIGKLLTGGASASAVSTMVRQLERADFEPQREVQPPLSMAPSAAPEPEPAASATPIVQEAAVVETLRVATRKLDALTLQAEDLLAPKLAAFERAHEAAALARAIAECRADLVRGRNAARGVAPDDPGAAPEPELRLLARQAGDLAAHLARDHRAMSSAVESLLDEARRLRMTPASSVLDLFPGMARELARAQGKDVDCIALGGALEVDRRVLQAAKDPLIHLVRNAVDHGIERPLERARAGKPARGRIGIVVASLEGGRIEIRVDDDGAGVDLGGVREAAARAGVMTPEAAAAVSDAEAMELVYRSGLSTSAVISDMSGHGLGLTIVKECVERLAGRIEVESRRGAGTCVRLTLPASIATFRGVLVRAAGQPFLLDFACVERAIRVAPETIDCALGREAIRWQGRPLFLASLRELLELGEGKGEGQAEPLAKRPCVVLRLGDERLGLVVDEIAGDREVILKQLHVPLVRVRNVSGAGILGSGEMALILRPSDLLRASHRPLHAVAEAADAAPRQPVILVVDDSITTRTMEKNLLESAGYRVRVAVDGIDAWTALKSEAFDLVLSDIDMPRLDGFGLTVKIRGDAALCNLPVVLVTALDSREDKERGIEAGANAYVVKSSFDQSNLLEIVARLM